MTVEVCIVGACVVDLVTRVPRLPVVGETLIGTSMEVHVGGKALNQAVAAACSGASTALVGRIGTDHHGELVTAALDRFGIDRRGIYRSRDLPTGVGLPIVDDRGENAIVLVPGANSALSVADIDSAEALLRSARVVVVQLEVPMAATVRAVELARSGGARVILNAAPMSPEVAVLRGLVDLLVVNEVEAEQLDRLAVDGLSGGGRDLLALDDHAAATATARRLVSSWPPASVIMTRGPHPIVIEAPGVSTRMEIDRVEATDTVGAGDALVGAMAAMVAGGQPLVDALSFGAAAAAIAVTRPGGSSAMPTRAEVVAASAP